MAVKNRQGEVEGARGSGYLRIPGSTGGQAGTELAIVVFPTPAHAAERRARRCAARGIASQGPGRSYQPIP